MKKLFFVMAILGTAALMCSAGTKIDFSHTVDWASYHTYSWIKIQASNSLWEDRIRNNVDQQLMAKGWMMVPSGGDASVSAFRSTKEIPSINTFYSGFGGGWRWGGMDGISTTTESTQAEGTITIDIFDTKSKNLIWRGTDTNNLSGNPEKNDKQLAKDVDDLFKKFPPKSKQG